MTLRAMSIPLAMCIAAALASTGRAGATRPPADPRVEKNLRRLKDKDWLTRGVAAEELGNANDPRAVAPLAALLTTKEEGWDGEAGKTARNAAAQALAKLGPAGLGALFAALRDEEEAVRDSAAAVLAEIEDPPVKARLMALLKDRDENVRRAVAGATPGDADDPASMKPFLDALRDSDPGVRKTAAEQLRLFKPVPLLIGLLKGDPQAVCRKEAARLLGEIGDAGAGAVEPLIAALRDRDPGVRESAMVSLGNLKDPRAVDALLAATKDEANTEALRKQAAAALGAAMAKTETRLPVLLAVLQEGGAGAAEAAETLGGLGADAKAAAPALARAAVGAGDLNLRSKAAQALQRMGPAGQPAIPVLIDALERQADRSGAIAVLAMLGPHKGSVVPTLRQALSGISERLGGRDAENLGRIGEASVPLLLKLVPRYGAEENWAVLGLGLVGPDAREAVGVIENRLAGKMHGDDDSGVYHFALARITGREEHVQKLIGLVRAGRGHTRGINPVECLARLGPQARSAIPALLDEVKRDRYYGGVGGALAAVGGGAIVPQVAPIFREGDIRARQRAAVVLAAIGKPAVSVLAEAVEDKDTRIRHVVFEALSRLGPDAKEAIPALQKALSNPAARDSAAEVLKVIEHTGETVVSARDVAARVRYLIGLGEFEKLPNLGKDAVPTLIRTLSDGDARVRAGVARALGKMKDPRATEAMLGALKDGDADVRREAARGLGEIKDPRSLDGLLAALTDPREGVRRNAARALGPLGDSRAVDALIRCLRQPPYADKAMDGPPAAEYAAKSLALLRDPRAVEPLLTMEELNNDVILSCLTQLGPPAVPALCAALKHKSPDVRKRAVVALGKIGDPRAVDPLCASLKDSDRWIRQDAASALGAIGVPVAARALMEAAAADPTLEGPAKAALARLGKSAVRPELALLRDTDSRIRVNALQAMVGDAAGSQGWARDGEVAATVIAAIRDPDPMVREKACEVLSNVQQWRPRAEAPLIAALKDPIPGVRAAAANALRDSTAAVEPLIALLGDSHPLVRRCAQNTLSRTSGKNFGQDQERWRQWWREYRKKLYLPENMTPEQRSVIEAETKAGALSEKLKDSDPRVRRDAAKALGEMRFGLFNPAIRRLVEALRDNAPEVRAQAAWALKQRTREDFGQDHAKWTEWRDQLDKEEEERRREMLKDAPGPGELAPPNVTPRTH